MTEKLACLVDALLINEFFWCVPNTYTILVYRMAGKSGRLVHLEESSIFRENTGRFLQMSLEELAANLELMTLDEWGWKEDDVSK